MANDDIVFTSNAAVRGSVGGHGVFAGGSGNVTFEEDSAFVLSVYPGKVMGGITSIYGICAAGNVIVNDSNIKVDIAIDPSIYYTDYEGLYGVYGVRAHGGRIEVNNCLSFAVNITSSTYLYDDEMIIGSIYGLHAQDVLASGSSLNVKVEVPCGVNITGVKAAGIQLINESTLRSNTIGCGEVFGVDVRDVSDADHDGMHVHQSALHTSANYPSQAPAWAKGVCIALVCGFFDLSVPSYGLLHLETENGDAALAVILGTSRTPISPEADYVATKLIENGHEPKTEATINHATFLSGSTYVEYESYFTTDLSSVCKELLIY